MSPSLPYGRLAWALLILAISAACPTSTPTGPTLTAGGARLRFEADAGTFTLERDAAHPLLRFDATSFEAATVRALDDGRSYDPYWLLVDGGVLPAESPPGLRWRHVVDARVEQTADTQVTLHLTLEGELPATVQLDATADGFTLHFSSEGDGTSPVAFLKLRARASASEGLYGLGEWFDGINHRGKLRPMQLEADLGLESAYNEAHAPVPLLLGSNGWALFVASERPGVFDLARSDPEVIETIWGTADSSAQGLEVQLYAATNPLDLLLPYFRRAGFPALPAPWALGPWIWRDENLNQAEVEDDVAKLRALDLATSGVWIDRPYATDVNTFDFAAAQFPDPVGMVATLHAAGLRTALWHTPYLSVAAPLRAQADSAGFFPPKLGPQLNGWSPPLDFTNPAAETFWRQQLAAYVTLGIEGFKLDYGEDVVPGLSGKRAGWTFADGSSDRTMHHGYTLLYHRTYRRALGAEPGFLLARAAKWGDQVNGIIVWPGDLDANLSAFGERVTEGTGNYTAVGGLPSALRGGLGLSVSGFPLFGADTGGYRHSPPNRETWLRWVEHSALGTVMQTGDSSSQPPWLYTAENGRDDAALDVYRRFARLHLRLFPYVWSHLAAIAATGRPVLRPYGLAFPSVGLHPEDVFLLGDDLFVAPVERAAATSKRFPAPPGQWVNWFDGTRFDGGAGGEERTVAAPVDTLPLFVRAGALVPMLRPTIDTLAPTTLAGVESFADDPGTLFVRTVRGDGSFTLYDGTTLSQTAGGALEAGVGTVFKDAVVFELIAEPAPASVTAAGALLIERADLSALLASPSGWFHSSETGGTLWIKASVPAAVSIEP